MTTIDHRILVPAAPEVVWDYISDISRNPKWQVDCQEVIFLTSRREGPGLRWRYSTPGGGECVVAVTAWYNGLGYEYYFVDGTPFRENQGRIRLQEIPEGTIVQWTFTYKLGGVFSGMRNSLGMKRQVDHTIADSLKSLWQEIKQSAAPGSHEPKSLMRHAPGVEARSAYQPRHPSVVSQEQPAGVNEPPISTDDAQRIQAIPEPPIADEDTRPRPALAPTPEATPAATSDDLVTEPEFLNRLDDLVRFEPPIDPTDTKPRAPVEVASEAAPQEQAVETAAEPPPAEAPLHKTEPLPLSESPLPTPSLVLDDDDDTLVEIEIPPKPAIVDDADTLILPTPNAAATAEAEADKTPSRSPLTEPRLQPAAETSKPPDLPRLETDEVEGDTSSIWEVFGVPRPSESQEMRAVKLEPEPESVEVEPPTLLPEHLPPRVGLRLVLRRKLVRLRRY